MLHFDKDHFIIKENDQIYEDDVPVMVDRVLMQIVAYVTFKVEVRRQIRVVLLVEKVLIAKDLLSIVTSDISESLPDVEVT